MTDNTMPEPVAWTDAIEIAALNKQHQAVVMWSKEGAMGLGEPIPLYTAEQLQAERDRAERAEAEVSRLKKQCEGLAQAAMNNGQDLLLKEAAIAEARKVIEPFEEYAKEYHDDEADTTKMPVRIGHLRALNAWLSANPEVKR